MGSPKITREEREGRPEVDLRKLCGTASNEGLSDVFWRRHEPHADDDGYDGWHAWNAWNAHGNAANGHDAPWNAPWNDAAWRGLATKRRCFFAGQESEAEETPQVGGQLQYEQQRG